MMDLNKTKLHKFLFIPRFIKYSFMFPLVIGAICFYRLFKKSHALTNPIFRTHGPGRKIIVKHILPFCTQGSTTDVFRKYKLDTNTLEYRI